MCAKVKDIAMSSRSVAVPKIGIENPVIKNAYLALLEESMYYPIKGKPENHNVKDIVKKKLEFEPINEIAVSMSFYLIIETEHLKDNLVEASIVDENDEVLFKDKLGLNTSKSQHRKLYGSYLGKDSEGNRKVLRQDADVKLFDYISNKEAFKDVIIKKINLPVDNEPANEVNLRKKIAKSKNKMFNVVIKIDAHTPNSKFKGKEERIKYLGINDPRKIDTSKVNNYFIFENKDYYQLKAWRGIVVHSMGDKITVNNVEINHKDFIISKNLSVHAYIRPNGAVEEHQDLFMNAAHAGESYDAGVSGMNESYLGFELTVNDATDVEKLEMICNRTSKVKNNEVIECENRIRKLDKEIENLNSEIIANKKKLSLIDSKKKSKLINKKTRLENRISLLKLNPSVYPDIQFNAAVKLTKKWMEMFNINPLYVVRHSDISGETIRHGPKFDPGVNFKWDDFKYKITPIKISDVDQSKNLPT